MSVLEATGRIIRITENRVYHPDALDTLAGMALALSAEHESSSFDAKAFRDRTSIGRNLSIGVLEYFDRVGLTQRVLDRRKFR